MWKKSVLLEQEVKGKWCFLTCIIFTLLFMTEQTYVEMGTILLLVIFISWWWGKRNRAIEKYWFYVFIYGKVKCFFIKSLDVSEKLNFRAGRCPSCLSKWQFRSWPYRGKKAIFKNVSDTFNIPQVFPCYFHTFKINNLCVAMKLLYFISKFSFSKDLYFVFIIFIMNSN